MKTESNEKTAAKVTKTAAKATLSELHDAIAAALAIAIAVRKTGSSSDAYHASQCERQLDTMAIDIAAELAMRD